ncbi:MAG: hypothetical protein NTW14_08995 [bacterium]|nr:hypothetical protein [bacterium]
MSKKTSADPRKEFEEMREAITLHFRECFNYLENYDTVVNIQDKERELYQFASFFFKDLRKAFWCTLVLWIYKLTKDKYVGMIHLLNFAEEHTDLFTRNGTISPESIKTDRKTIEKNPEFISIMNRRHHYYGHFNPEFVRHPELMEKKYPITWKNLTAAIDEAWEILQKYSCSYDGGCSAKYWLRDGSGGIGKVIDLIRNQSLKIEREQQEEYNRLFGETGINPKGNHGSRQRDSD